MVLRQKIDTLAKRLFGKSGEQLDYQPARCFRKVTKRVKVRSKDDSTRPPLLAPAPTTPLVGGLPSFNLVTELIIGKYADHLPIYRQQHR